MENATPVPVKIAGAVGRLGCAPQAGGCCCCSRPSAREPVRHIRRRRTTCRGRGLCGGREWPRRRLLGRQAVLLDALDVVSDRTRLDLQANSELRICRYQTRQLLTLKGPLRASISVDGVVVENGETDLAGAGSCAAPVVSTFQGGIVSRGTAVKTMSVAAAAEHRGGQSRRAAGPQDRAVGQRCAKILMTFDRAAARPILDEGQSYLLVVERNDGSEVRVMLSQLRRPRPAADSRGSVTALERPGGRRSRVIASALRGWAVLHRPFPAKTPTGRATRALRSQHSSRPVETLAMSLRFLIKLAALASTCWLSVSQALAENRIALVIGNSNYAAVAALPNPANDAKAMATFLTSAGFEVVQAPDLTQSDLRRTIGNFARSAAAKGPDTVVLVFYAGHGLQVDGENFLVPVDAQIEREADVPLQAMRLADVMNALSTDPQQIHRRDPGCLPQQSVFGDQQDGRPRARDRRRAERLARILLDRARQRGARRRWAQQSVHGGAHEDRARAGTADRAVAQTCPARRQQRDRQPAIPMGKLVLDRGVFVLPGRHRAGEDRDGEQPERRRKVANRDPIGRVLAEGVEVAQRAGGL